MILANVFVLDDVIHNGSWRLTKSRGTLSVQMFSTKYWIYHEARYTITSNIFIGSNKLSYKSVKNSQMLMKYAETSYFQFTNI